MAIAGLMVIVIVVALVVYATYHSAAKSSSTSIFSVTRFASTPSTSTSSATSNSSIDSSQSNSQVELGISQWAKSIDNLSTSSQMTLYTNSSVLTLNANGTGVQCSQIVENGNYTGISSIRNVYSLGYAYILYPSPSLITISNLTLKDVGGTVRATFRLFVNGTSSVYLGVRETVNVQQQWTTQRGQWRISEEHWDFQTVSVQAPKCI